MGDIADYYIEQIQNQYDDYNYEPDPEYEPNNGIRCKYCNLDQLYWQRVGEKFRLFDTRTGKMHNCKVNPLKE